MRLTLCRSGSKTSVSAMACISVCPPMIETIPSMFVPVLSSPSQELTPVVGFTHFPAADDVCCATRKSHEGFQSRETCRESTASGERTARCPGVGNFEVDYRSTAHYPYRFSKLFITHLDDEFKKQPDPALRHLVSNQVMNLNPN